MLNRDEDIKTEKSSKLCGFVIANPDLSIEEQINEAVTHNETVMLPPSENDRVCAEVDPWLTAAIENLPDVKDKNESNRGDVDDV